MNYATFVLCKSLFLMNWAWIFVIGVSVQFLTQSEGIDQINHGRPDTFFRTAGSDRFGFCGTQITDIPFGDTRYGTAVHESADTRVAIGGKQARVTTYQKTHTLSIGSGQKVFWFLIPEDLLFVTDSPVFLGFFKKQTANSIPTV